MIEVHAPAKINLGLEILRKRPDGYHDINTLFAAVDLTDHLEIRRTDREVLCRVEGNATLAAESYDENLCTRAARLLLSELGVDGGVEIVLRKSIPIGAGLGGGSSDAAATLKGILQLFETELDPDRLARVALSIGSDVPFFLSGGLAVGGGQGEVLEPWSQRLPWHILLVNPGVHISTPEAFRLVGREGERSPSNLRRVIERALLDPALLATELINDFQEPVFQAWPEVEEIHHHIAMATNPLYSGMSGSGSTLFGLYNDRASAFDAAEHFPEHFTHVGTLG